MAEPVLETFAQPDDLGPLRASELHASLGERFSAQASEALFGGVRTLYRIGQYAAAEGGAELTDLPTGGFYASAAAERPIAELPIADAKARVKQEGLERYLPRGLPDQPTIKQPVLELMLQHAHERRQYEAAVSRGPQGFWPDALGFITEMGVGMIDPVNIAAFSIPVVGEARYGMMLARAGESVLARTGVRAGVGAAQGALGGAALAPADWWLHTKDGQDYTFADALRSVVLSAGMGGTFHAGLGALGDVRARLGGRELPGSLADLRARALAGDTRAAELVERLAGAGTHVPGAALAAEGIPLEQVPGIAAENAPAAPAAAPAPVHPAAVLADLPPRLREDVARASIADLINGEPVRAGELIAEAAKEDPRIAESIEAWHGSPHDFERFSLEHVGTGEGAQSYGHGLYFAENDKVAQSYIAAGSSHTGRGIATIWLKNFGTREAAIKSLERKIDSATPWYQEAIDLLRNPNWSPSQTLYRVRITADKQHFLDWDKPLSEQSEHVKAALQRVVKKEIDWSQMGGEFIRSFGSDPGGQNTALMRAAGIPGLKYRDQGSRAVGSKGAVDDTIVSLLDAVGGDRQKAIRELERRIRTAESLPEQYRSKATNIYAALEALKGDWQDPRTHNFVVFDDSLIRITHKNGQEIGLAALKVARPAMTGRPEVDQVLADPYVARAVAEPKINRANDVPYGAGPNKANDGVTNIDRHVPERDIVNGREYDPAIPAAIHEQVEKHVMEAMSAKAEAARGRKLTDAEVKQIYGAAHFRFAEAAERAWVEQHLGLGAWDEYQAHWAKWLEPIEHENPKHPPGDLYQKPYPHDDVHLAPRTRDEEFAGGRARSPLPSPPPRGGEGARGAADWQKFAERKPQDEDLAAAANEAKATPEPASIDQAKAPSAAVEAAAEADKLLNDILPRLSEEERALFQDALDKLRSDKDAHETIVREGAECLLAAIA